MFGSKALQIEHIGSTSVPGMKAKPLIDILVVVQRMEPFTSEREEMTRLGYKSKDNYIQPDSILFYKEDEDQYTGPSWGSL